MVAGEPRWSTALPEGWQEMSRGQGEERSPGVQTTPVGNRGPAELPSDVLSSMLEKTLSGASGAASSFIRHCENIP